MLVLLLLTACSGSTDPVVEGWLVAPRLEAAPLAEGAGYVFDTPQAAFFAAGHVTPDVDSRWSFPATQIPLLLWEDVLLGENIADPGSCPFVVADGPETTWQTNCRSQDGYNWSGTVTKVIWEEESGDWMHYEFDLEVETDIEEKALQRVAIQGEFYYADGDDAPLVRHAEANLLVEADGYWANGFEDELEAAWSSLKLSGTWETELTGAGRTHRFETRADLGDYGGFAADAEGLVEENGCVVEPKGSVTFAGDVDAELVFEGASRCDGCAELYIDGVRSTNACRGY